MSPKLVVVMGVSGCGKTTLAKSLAEAIRGMYLEGDDYHSPANKEKMGAGIPLEDADRWPWFDAIKEAAREILAEGKTAVLACSALKKIHRDYLFDGISEWRLIHLEGSFDLIKSRMEQRNHEYMTSDLLRSQFEALELPTDGRKLLTLSIEKTPEELVEASVCWLASGD